MELDEEVSFKDFKSTKLKHDQHIQMEPQIELQSEPQIESQPIEQDNQYNTNYDENLLIEYNLKIEQLEAEKPRISK